MSDIGQGTSKEACIVHSKDSKFTNTIAEAIDVNLQQIASAENSSNSRYQCITIGFAKREIAPLSLVPKAIVQILEDW